MKSIQEIDKNYAQKRVNRDDVVWHSVLEAPIEIYGLCDSYKNGEFVRMPAEYQENESINEGCRVLMTNTAGGRVKLATDSPYLAVKVELISGSPMAHMPSTGHSGIDVYMGRRGSSDQRFIKTFFPPNTDDTCYDAEVPFGGFALDYNEYELTLNLPLYNGIKSLYIGLKEGSNIFSPVKYKIEKPVAFYGSSITQGGCASRPGNNYMNHLSRWLDCDFLNFGFSGSARGEQEVAEYIASRELSGFVLDYDANAPSAEHLEKTHYAFYETVRKAHPHIPIIMVSMPRTYRLFGVGGIRDAVACERIVMESYLKALNNGDTNVYHMDGSNWYAGAEADACTVDNCHPNDLGFYVMAKNMYPVLKRGLFR